MRVLNHAGTRHMQTACDLARKMSPRAVLGPMLSTKTSLAAEGGERKIQTLWARRMVHESLRRLILFLRRQDALHESRYRFSLNVLGFSRCSREGTADSSMLERPLKVYGAGIPNSIPRFPFSLVPSLRCSKRGATRVRQARAPSFGVSAESLVK